MSAAPRNDQGDRPDFDPVWEEIYAGGQANRYPWDAVVSFVHRYRPLDKKIAETGVLEIGCGTAPNLWFAAREGFQVAGIDASETAIAVARERFAKEDLDGDLRVGSFTELPFADGGFDMAIDRAALTCAGQSVARQAISEVHRALRIGGAFFCNVYSDAHASHGAGKAGPDGLTLEIAGGSLTGVGQVCFYSRQGLLEQFPEAHWIIESLAQLTLEETVPEGGAVHAEWRLIARKK